MAITIAGHKYRDRNTVEGGGGYTPPTPSALITPNVDYVVGVAPFVSGGLSLTTYPTTGGPFGNIVSGVLTLSTPNIVVSGYDIPARLVYGANNITTQQCNIRGGPPITSGGDHGLVENNGHFTGGVLKDCTLKPDNPTAWINGVRGDNLTVLRCDIINGCDGMDLFSNNTGVASNTVVEGCYIHDLIGYDPDSIGRAWSHNDCIQITDGIGITVRYNNLQGFLDPSQPQDVDPTKAPNYPALNSNSVLQLTQGTGPVTGLLWDNNYQDGGGATLNLIATGQAARNVGSITNNKFGRASFFQGGGAGTDGTPGSGGDNGVTFLSQSGLSYTSTSGNVYKDNGHPITLRIS
jgi:hypothetical protein